jgi:hypothetical protein
MAIFRIFFGNPSEFAGVATVHSNADDDHNFVNRCVAIQLGWVERNKINRLCCLQRFPVILDHSVMQYDREAL